VKAVKEYGTGWWLNLSLRLTTSFAPLREMLSLLPNISRKGAKVILKPQRKAPIKQYEKPETETVSTSARK